MLSLRNQFPIFARHPELTYLDSAATSQKPQAVIDAVSEFYSATNAPVHRGLYPLGIGATGAYEAARSSVARFIGASTEEIIFTRGATESLNLLASSLSKSWPAGSAVIVSRSEHHANFLPWQQLGIELRIANLLPTGETDLRHVESLIDERVVAVSLAHCSNVLGTFTPLPEVRKIMDRQGSRAVLIADLCQSIPHLPVDVRTLDCDFAVFSGHKAYGPSGIGALWGKRSLLEALPPYQFGGEMIASVTAESATWNDVPWKFEAGTPNVEGAIGLAAALDWIRQIGLSQIETNTVKLSMYLSERLPDIPGMRILGRPDPRSGIVSFVVEGTHPHDLAQLLGSCEVCIRAGHHCAAPLHQALGITASNRISFGVYNTLHDIDRALALIDQVVSEIRHA